MPQQRTIIKAFTDMAPEYEAKINDELQRFWGWSYPDFIDRILSKAHIKLGDRVLDIATGTGFIPRQLFLNGNSPSKVIALDLTLAMLGKGKTLIHAKGLQEVVHLTCGSATDIPLQDGYFDVIICGLASHHMDVPTFLRELKRVAKPGGSITIADVGSAPHWRNPFVNSFLRAGAFFYFLPGEGFSRAVSESASLSNILSPDEWRMALHAEGLIDIQIEELTTNHFWSPVPLIMRAVSPI